MNVMAMGMDVVVMVLIVMFMMLHSAAPRQHAATTRALTYTDMHQTTSRQRDVTCDMWSCRGRGGDAGALEEERGQKLSLSKKYLLIYSL